MLVKHETRTADELLALSAVSQNRHLLVKGELISMTPPGVEHGALAVDLASALQAFVRSRRLGRVIVEAGYRLETQPDTVLGPDVSFITAGRLPPGPLPGGYFSGAPDLAVEIVSPSDTDQLVQTKLQLYFGAGARQVWVIRPSHHTLTAHLPDGSARTLHPSDTLTGGDLLPGFALPLAEILD